MEAGDSQPTTLPPAAPHTTTITTTAGATTSTSPRGNPASPKRSLREPKLKRVSPRTAILAGKDTTTTRAASKSLRSATSSRPLVPLTERRSHEDKTLSRANKDVEAEKWEVAPDGGSAGREGRQFTVANVGNNGRIYLRYEHCLRALLRERCRSSRGMLKTRGIWVWVYTDTFQAYRAAGKPTIPSAKLYFPCHATRYCWSLRCEGC